MQRTAVLCFTVFALVSLKTSYAFDDGDFQVWHTEAQELKINKDFKATLEEEFRFGDDASQFYYQHYDLGFVHAFNKDFDLGVNYRQVYEKKNGKFIAENRPHINATLKSELLGFKLDDRSRLEYRNIAGQTAQWRYRNKFTAKFPWKFTKFEVQPYLADEIFIDFNSNGFSRNRFYCGLAMNFFKNLKAEVYYLLQNSKSSGAWKYTNVLGSKIKLYF